MIKKEPKLQNHILISELDDVSRAFQARGAPGACEWEKYEGRCLVLPEWFDATLDPLSQAYSTQQHMLWKTICGVSDDYDPARDEQLDEARYANSIYFPGFYAGRGPGGVHDASNHIIALGHILKRSNIVAGDWALEYGAGYGQIALTLARLGVNVDTVDINQDFNRVVSEQARHFSVNLNSFNCRFGDNPRGDAVYKLVLFYESFHHCADFMEVIPKLRSLLHPTGRILMAGEPIVASDHPAVPYPWGVRLDAETVAVMRWRHWFELGFSESFLSTLFIRNGFVWRKYPCELTHYGVAHEFLPRPNRIEFSDYQLPDEIDATWHGREPTGRWSRADSIFPVHDLGCDGHVVIHACNYHAQPISITVDAFGASECFAFIAGEQKKLAITIRPDHSGIIRLRSEAIAPSSYGAEDVRELGIFIQAIEYA